MSTHGRWVALLLLGLIGLGSCTRQVPPRILAIPSLVAANSPDAFAAVVPSATSEPSPQITAPRSETPSATTTFRRRSTLAVPSATPFILSSPEPSDLDIARFIRDRHYPRFSDGFFDRINRGEPGAHSRERLDLDGDGELELLVTGQPSYEFVYLAIITYRTSLVAGKDNGYWEELYFADRDGWYGAEARYEVVDGQVIISFTARDGGTGALVEAWEQRWVRCGGNGCREVWSGQRMQVDIEDGGMLHNLQEYVYTTIDQFDANHLQVTSHHFAIRDVPQVDKITVDLVEFGIAIPNTGQTLGPEVLEKYDWDGERYQLVSREEITPGIDINREFDNRTQEAISWWWDRFKKPEPVGIIYSPPDYATELADFWGVPTSKDPLGYVWDTEHVRPSVAALSQQTLAGIVIPENFPLCRITVQKYTGDKFDLVGRADAYCTRNFTKVAWVDVDGDDKQELLLLTYHSTGQAGIQRLTVFRVQDGLSQIAQVDGVANGADGVGIKWEKRRGEFIVFAGVPLANELIGWRFDPLLPGNWMRDYNSPCTNPWSNLGDCLVTRYFKEFRWDPKSQSFVP